MMKTAYVFPGQGAQYPGMGRDLYDSSSEVRELYRTAGEILGFSIGEIMFSGSEDALRQTLVTQPAIFLDSVAQAVCRGGNEPDMVAGHSLGEFSALVACGALDFEQALRLVSARAGAMQKCCEKTPGKMAAILALDTETIESVCKTVCDETGLTVIPANYNCPGQVVISGDDSAVSAACEKLKAAGAKRAMPLGVNGAFHSPLMESAREELSRAIEQTEFNTPRCPIYQNVDALPHTDPSEIKENLLKQLTSAVKWTQTVQNMLADGAEEFIELGPGTTLTGLIKRIRI